MASQFLTAKVHSVWTGPSTQCSI